MSSLHKLKLALAKEACANDKTGPEAFEALRVTRALIKRLELETKKRREGK